MITPFYSDDLSTVYHGDCLDVLRELPDASVDAVVTDPPYGLEFMGKDWDGSDGFRRSLNPADAGRDSVFGRTSRTSPEYRTSGAGQRSKPGIGTRETEWVSNQGWNTFRCAECGHLPHGGSRCRCDNPRMVRAANRWPLFQQWCEQWAAECLRVLKPGGYLLAFGGTRTVHRLTVGIEDAGFEIRDGIDWIYGSGFPKSLNLGDGRGTALKPAREPIVVARKPPTGTVATNVLAYGTGALNIDACRVGDEERTNHAGGTSSLQRVSRVEQGYRTTITTSVGEASTVTGRWPSNVVLSHAPDCTDTCLPGCSVAALDMQSGTSVSRASGSRAGRKGDGWRMKATGAEYDDQGGASRFFPVFRYEAKAPTAERPRTADGIAHPTVKPLALMQWLVRLVTPSGGLVLDPFAGSGTTAEACALEGLRCIAIEREATYVPLITARLSRPLQPALDIFGGAA